MLKVPQSDFRFPGMYKIWEFMVQVGKNFNFVNHQISLTILICWHGLSLFSYPSTHWPFVKCHNLITSSVWGFCPSGHSMYGCLICKWFAVTSFNSLWPGDAMWWLYRSCSTLVQVMVCCLMAPSHYLNQLWLPIMWHQPESNFTATAEATNSISMA